MTAVKVTHDDLDKVGGVCTSAIYTIATAQCPGLAMDDPGTLRPGSTALLTLPCTHRHRKSRELTLC